MNPFLLPRTERLADWKVFRDSLSAFSEEDQLRLVASYWAQAPLLKVAYDPENPKSWPSPWEAVHDGNWCRDSTAIGMDFTLRLSGWEPSRLELRLIDDHPNSNIVLVLKVDGTIALNYEWNTVTEFPSDFHTLRKYHWDGRHYSG